MPTVNIKVVGQTIKASPDPVRVDRYNEEKVDWICQEGRFEVDFGNRSPFAAPKYGGPKGTPKSSGPCRKNAEKGPYKYSIKVWVSEPGAPIVEDPGVDVWDSGGGDGKLGGSGSSSGSSEESSSSA